MALSLTLAVTGVFSHVRLEISCGVGISVLGCVDSGFFMLRGVDVLDISSLGSFGRHTEFVNGRCLSLSVDPVDRLWTLLTVCGPC